MSNDSLNRKPRRIQRKRSAGWKMPKNTVYVGRPTKWGNPFQVDRTQRSGALGYLHGVADTPTHAVIFYRMHLNNIMDDRCKHFCPEAYCPREAIVRQLRGKNLACWCPLDQPCHADILLEIANGN
jgi:hypothetical protein